MVITEEEASKIKEHLLDQLENFPEDRRTKIKDQINSMSTEEVETFIEKNNLTHLGGKCIFCSIIAGKTPSYKIGSNSGNIAILELNPLSKGHSLIVPKEHLDKIPESTNLLAQEIAKKIDNKFDPVEIKLNEIEVMGHAILEITPLYGGETTKREASKEELLDTQSTMNKIRSVEIKEKHDIGLVERKDDVPILPPRIP